MTDDRAIGEPLGGLRVTPARVRHLQMGMAQDGGLSGDVSCYRGGGHDDWRLPTEAELEVFAQPEASHKDKSDCTRGASYVAATPLVHLSCGLAWSSTVVGKRAVAFGFLSASSRFAAKTERKNYRALVVRGAQP